MSTTTGRLAARTHRRQRSITRAAVPGNIRKAILPAMWGSCEPVPLTDTTSSARLGGSRRRSLKRRAGATAGGVCRPGEQGEAPIASEAVRRIDVLFEVERTINGKTPEQWLVVRRERSRSLIAELEIWLRQQRALLSAKNDTAKVLPSPPQGSVTRFLDEGRVCLTDNAAERALRGVAVGRRNWTFAGSDAGGHRAAAVYTLTETCKMNDVDPQARSLTCWPVPDHRANKVGELLPWNWKAN
jgi:hypothetical protein